MNKYLIIYDGEIVNQFFDTQLDASEALETTHKYRIKYAPQLPYIRQITIDLIASCKIPKIAPTPHVPIDLNHYEVLKKLYSDFSEATRPGTALYAYSSAVYETWNNGNTFEQKLANILVSKWLSSFRTEHTLLYMDTIKTEFVKKSLSK